MYCCCCHVVLLLCSWSLYQQNQQLLIASPCSPSLLHDGKVPVMVPYRLAR
jgi:hypothetical protein